MIRSLPPSLYQIGEIFYRSGEDWMEIFSFKPAITSAQADDEPYELAVPPAPPDFDASSPTGRRLAPVPAKQTPLVHWVTRAGGRMHRNAVRVGDFPTAAGLGGVLGRAYCCGQLLVGKVHSQDRVCYVAYEEMVFAVMRYEVLVLERGKVEWVACRNGYVPPSALPGGMTLQSIKIYPVRVSVNGMHVPGQIIKGERCCRVPYDKHELTFREYDVLTLRCQGDDSARQTTRMGPTDEEWEEFLNPKSSKPLSTPRSGKRDYTGAPVRGVCLPPLESPEDGNSNPGTSAPPAGENVPGPSQPMGSSDTGTTEREMNPKRFQPQPIARPRL